MLREDFPGRAEKEDFRFSKRRMDNEGSGDRFRRANGDRPPRRRPEAWEPHIYGLEEVMEAVRPTTGPTKSSASSSSEICSRVMSSWGIFSSMPVEKVDRNSGALPPRNPAAVFPSFIRPSRSFQTRGKEDNDCPSNRRSAPWALPHWLVGFEAESSPPWRSPAPFWIRSAGETRRSTPFAPWRRSRPWQMRKRRRGG